jgi:hypothetical protein
MNFLIKILLFIHGLFVLFLFFGFLLPKKYLLLHLVTWPLVWLHWQLNNQKCILTEWEFNLRDEPIPHIKDNHSPFMKKFFRITLGRNISNESIYYLTNIGFTIAWLITLLRLKKIY